MPAFDLLTTTVIAVAVGVVAALWTRHRHRRALADELASREAVLTSVLQGSPDIIGLLDEDGTFTFLNRATFAVHGYRPEELVGTNVFDLFHPDDRGMVLRAVQEGDLASGVEITHRMYDVRGAVRHVETKVSRPIRGSGYVLNVRDVTERRKLEAEILHHALHDALTGLANRRAFTARLDEALARYARSGQPVGLVMVDLDAFKPVNDTHGHQAGDEVLVEVARRLSDGVRATDLVARMGGDEFAVVCEGANDEGAVAALAARVEARLHEPIRLSRGTTVTVSASLGVATAWPGCDGDELLREADQRLYATKRAHHEAEVVARR